MSSDELIRLPHHLEIIIRKNPASFIHFVDASLKFKVLEVSSLAGKDRMSR